MMMLLFLRAGVYPLSEGLITPIMHSSRTAPRTRASDPFDYIHSGCVACKMEIFHVLLAVGTYPRPGSALPNFFFLTTQSSGSSALFYPGLLVAVGVSYPERRRAT